MFTRRQIEQYQIIQLEDPSELQDVACYDKSSYNLRLGDECCLIGNGMAVENCSSGIGVLVIPPFSCVLVSTLEWLKMPEKVSGRWGLKIKYALSGLIFQAGPQIEPGYQGRLFGLLFNLSSSEQQLSFKEPIWAIDFQRFGTGKIEIPEKNSPLLRLRDFTGKGIPNGTISQLWDDSKKTLQRMEEHLSAANAQKEKTQGDKEKLQNLIMQRRWNWENFLLMIVTVIVGGVFTLFVTKSTYDKDDELVLHRAKMLLEQMEDLVEQNKKLNTDASHSAAKSASGNESVPSAPANMAMPEQGGGPTKSSSHVNSLPLIPNSPSTGNEAEGAVGAPPPDGGAAAPESKSNREKEIR